jgi:hypothetical protein
MQKKGLISKRVISDYLFLHNESGVEKDGPFW